jgi:hypothetical protein
MIHPDIQAMLVRERSATLLAAAAAYRRGRQARSAAMTASRAADATHLATTVGMGAERFITNNRRDSGPGIKEIDVTYPDALRDPAA